MKNIIIGIDFAKEKFDVCAMCVDGVDELAVEWHEPFINDTKGFNGLLSWAKRLCKKYHAYELLFCGENTGNYSRKAADHIYEKGYDLWLANPLVIKRGEPLKRGKNDKADALMIAKFAKKHYDERELYVSPSKELSDLREVYRHRDHLVREKMRLKVRNGEKQTTMKKTEGIKFIDQSSQRIIKVIDAEIRKCNEKLKELISSNQALRENYEIVTSVPGVALLTATCLLVYTDNFSRFGLNARRLACYYGVAPFGHESGSSVKGKPHVSHFCNKKIKAALHEAALSARTFNPSIRAYYERLIKRGKASTLAMNNVKSKLLHIIVALVRDRKKFDKNYQIPFAECPKQQPVVA